MLEQLRQIHRLCLEHEQFDDAGVLGCLIELHESDEDAFWLEICSGDVWGGMGSLADQCLVSSRTASDADRRRDQRLVWAALASIAEEMRSAGHPDERADSWASTFRSWLEQGV